MRKIILLTLTLTISLFAKTQIYQGIVVNDIKEPISYATVSLYSLPDSTFIKGCITDSTGYFKLLEKRGGYLKISFMGYNSRVIDLSDKTSNLGTIILNTAAHLLDEVNVIGYQKPLRIEKGKMMYSVPILIKNKPITTAYDAIKEIPGIMEQNESLSLIGANKFTILINGTKSSMPLSQLNSFLKSLPASKVKDIVVMYSTPPEYGVRGSSINVILTKSLNLKDVVQVEVINRLKQKYYLQSTNSASLSYQKDKLMTNVIIGYDRLRTKVGENVNSYQTYEGDKYHIYQKNAGNGKNKKYNWISNFVYNIDTVSSIELTYNGMYREKDGMRTSILNINSQNTDKKQYETETTNNGDNVLHNIALKYKNDLGFRIGGDYTYYNDETTQQLDAISNLAFNNLKTVRSNSTQNINNFSLFANNSHSLKNDWTINYGANSHISTVKNNSVALKNSVSDKNSSFTTKLQEINVSSFVGFSKVLNSKLTVNLSLELGYYKSSETSGEKTQTLWKDKVLYPNINISYVKSPNNIFQLSFNTDKIYPSFWAMSPGKKYLNAYSQSVGNQYLKPSQSYTSKLQYILNQKYVFILNYNHISDYFIQQGYQTPDHLSTIFKVVNFNYKSTIGLISVIPIRLGSKISSRIVLNGMYWVEKADDFYDIPFKRKKWFGVVQLNNDVNISDKPDLKFNLSGLWTSNPIQGLYDLDQMFDVSAGITWTFWEKQAKLILKASDIFNGHISYLNVNYRNQNNSMNITNDSRSIQVSFVYKFGNYKEKKIDKINNSRFGSGF